MGQVQLVAAGAALEACFAVGLGASLLLAVLPRERRQALAFVSAVLLVVNLLAFGLFFRRSALSVAGELLGMLLEALPSLYQVGRFVWDPLVTFEFFVLFLLTQRRGVPTLKAWLILSPLWLIWLYLPLLIAPVSTPGLVGLQLLALLFVGLPVRIFYPDSFSRLFTDYFIWWLITIPPLLVAALPAVIGTVLCKIRHQLPRDP